MEREALKLALEVIKDLLDQTETSPDKNCSCHIAPPCSDCVDYSGVRYAIEQANKAITAIKAALAQPAQEPDALTIAYQSGFYDGKQAARARCIELVLAGSSMPVQTKTLEALQRDRKRIAALIEEDGKP